MWVKGRVEVKTNFNNSKDMEYRAACMFYLYLRPVGSIANPDVY